jgi:hypothetical protein
MRAAMMRRFADWESQGKQCILLYAGEHDPGGLNISKTLRENLEALEDQIGWCPDNLVIRRFGLNREFIDGFGLSWIPNLITSSGGRLDDPNHEDHDKEYVQSYLRDHGVRKVEANALVTRPEEGRELCLAAILEYLPETAPEDYIQEIAPLRWELRDRINTIIRDGE